MSIPLNRFMTSEEMQEHGHLHNHLTGVVIVKRKVPVGILGDTFSIRIARRYKAVIEGAIPDRETKNKVYWMLGQAMPAAKIGSGVGGVILGSPSPYTLIRMQNLFGNTFSLMHLFTNLQAIKIGHIGPFDSVKKVMDRHRGRSITGNRRVF